MPTTKAATHNRQVPPDDAVPRRFVSIPDLARDLNVSDEWLYRRARQDSLPGLIRVGKRVLVDLDAFNAAPPVDTPADMGVVSRGRVGGGFS